MEDKMNPPNTQYFEAVELTEENEKWDAEPFNISIDYFHKDGKKYILRPISIVSEVTDGMPSCVSDGNMKIMSSYLSRGFHRVFYEKGFVECRSKLAPTIAVLKNTEQRMAARMQEMAREIIKLEQQLAAEKEKGRNYSKWCSSNGWRWSSKYNEWISYDDLQTLSDDQLYSIYLTSLNKQSEGK